MIQRLLTLQGTMKPHQIISLMTFQDADNTLVAAPTTTTTSTSASSRSTAPTPSSPSSSARSSSPASGTRLIERLGKIDNPTVRSTPSKAALKVDDPARTADGRTDERRFRFVQWEFAGRLGPPPGRYVVRRFAGDDVREVVVVTEADAPRRRAGAARRAARRRSPVTR